MELFKTEKRMQLLKISMMKACLIQLLNFNDLLAIYCGTEASY